MKKRKLFVKTVSLVMAIIMTLAVVPVQAIPLPQENEDMSNEIVSTGNIETTDQEVFIVEEDTSKRDQFEKHYLCSDGTYVSVTYPEAIHYLDDNSVWQDVDQSLTYNETTDMYSSKNKDFNVSFAAKGSSSKIARIEKNGYALSWGIQAVTKDSTIVSNSGPIKSVKSTDKAAILLPNSISTAKLASKSVTQFDKQSDRLVSNEDSFVLPNISSQISYSDVFNADQNVTLAYTVYHNKIEEDIIISERGDIHSVSMNMDIGTLTPVVNSDGSVDLVDDDNNMQFHVGIPYMVDAVYSLPQKIDTVIGERGVKLSGGQKERLAIARLILHSPQIIILDEATRALDSMVESEILNNLSEIFSNRTMIVISHKQLPNYVADIMLLLKGNTIKHYKQGSDGYANK